MEQKTLRRKEMNLKLYGRMLDSLHDGIYFVDNDRRITFWNKGAELITGFLAGEVVGTFCYDNLLNHVDGEGNRLCFGGCPLQATLLDQQDRNANVYLHHKNGHRVAVQVKTMPLYDEGKGFIGSIELFVPESRTFGDEWSNDELKTIAFTDALCEIPNRRYGELQLKKCRLEQEAGGVSYSVAMVDIDHFKKVNDAYGHDVGDKILQMVSRTLSEAVRSMDIPTRWGGEEFLLIFPGLEEEHFYPVLEKIRMMVETSQYRNGEIEVGVTISIGGATASLGTSHEELFKKADDNLYRAKNHGRNQVVV